MKKANPKYLDFEVDKLTNSIENIISGDSFPTDVLPVNKQDIQNITKKNGWNFNWNLEFNFADRDVYKLVISNNTDIIQGLISLSAMPDNVYIHLIENAPFNIGKNKIYSGVAGNLVAFACKLSFQRGHEGNVSFLSKNQLIEHYQNSLGAKHFGGRIMIIENQSALKLINKYFKDI